MVTLTIVYDTQGNGVQAFTRLFNKKANAIKQAQLYQADFCREYDIPMKEHSFGDEGFGETQYEPCTDFGLTLCESDNTDRLRIYLDDISVE